MVKCSGTLMKVNKLTFPRLAGAGARIGKVRGCGERYRALSLLHDMSTSPTDSTYSTQSNKRRRTSDASTFHSPGSIAPAPSHDGGILSQMQQAPPPAQQSQIPPGHIPKRGARACTACRKGKNRCEGDVSAPAPVRACTDQLVRPSARPGSPPHPPAPHASIL